MYRLAVQHYKDWIIEINKSNISNVDDLNFQSEYRKYFGIRSSNSFKLVFKDIIGYINLNLLSKMSELKNNI